MGMMINRRRVCSGKKGLLPSGYTQLEYIKNTSDAYIDTGVIGHGSSSIIVVAKYDTTPSNNTWPCVIGWKHAGGSQQRRVGIMSVNRSSWGFRYANNAANIGNFDNNKHTFIMNKGTFYLDGNVIVSYEESVFDTDNTLTIFVEKEGKNIGGYPLIGRIYLCKIDNVRNFIPCKNPNNVVGMYDTVNGVFYSSPNGTAFIAGPEV